MPLLDRLFLFLAGVILLLASWTTLSASMGGAMGLGMTSLLQRAPLYFWEAILIGLLLMIPGFYLLYRVFWFPAKEERTIITNHPLGQLTISLKAVQTLVQRAAVEVKGTAKVENTIEEVVDGLIIHIRMEVIPDVSFSEVSERVQERVLEYLAQTIEYPVKAVHVSIQQVAQGTRVRVE